MISIHLSFLQHFHTFNQLLKKLVLLHCNSSFILFIVNAVCCISEGSLKINPEATLAPYKSLFKICLIDKGNSNIALINKRHALSHNKGIKFLEISHKSILSHFSKFLKVNQLPVHLSLLEHTQRFSPILKKLILLHCNDNFIVFLLEVALNIIGGNLRISSKSGLETYRRLFKQLILSNLSKSTSSVKEKRKILSTPKGLKLLTFLYEPIIQQLTPKQEKK